MAEDRRTGFLDPRAWKLADVVIIGTLVFNFGWSHRAQADIEANVATNAANIATLSRENQQLRERCARLEQQAGIRAAGGAP